MRQRGGSMMAYVRQQAQTVMNQNGSVTIEVLRLYDFEEQSKTGGTIETWKVIRTYCAGKSPGAGMVWKRPTHATEVISAVQAQAQSEWQAALPSSDDFDVRETDRLRADGIVYDVVGLDFGSKPAVVVIIDLAKVGS